MFLVLSYNLIYCFTLLLIIIIIIIDNIEQCAGDEQTPQASAMEDTSSETVSVATETFKKTTDVFGDIVDHCGSSPSSLPLADSESDIDSKV